MAYSPLGPRDRVKKAMGKRGGMKGALRGGSPSDYLAQQDATQVAPRDPDPEEPGLGMSMLKGLYGYGQDFMRDPVGSIRNVGQDIQRNPTGYAPGEGIKTGHELTDAGHPIIGTGMMAMDAVDLLTPGIPVAGAMSKLARRGLGEAVESAAAPAARNVLPFAPSGSSRVSGGPTIRNRAGTGRTMTRPAPEAESILETAAAGVPPGQGFGSLRGQYQKGELFDYSNIGQVPNRPQQDLIRYDPPRGVSSRLEDAIQSDAVRQGLSDDMAAGLERGAGDWYWTEPLREEFGRIFGPQLGEIRFAQYMDQVAVTSARQKVPDNIRAASFLHHDSMTRGILGGMPPAKYTTPSGSQSIFPPGYGNLAQGSHRSSLADLYSGKWDQINMNKAGTSPVSDSPWFDRPKYSSFSQNLQGNWNPATIDVGITRALARHTEDPRFLETSVQMGTKEAPDIRRPQKLYEAGAFQEAENWFGSPLYLSGAPNKNEYGAYERLVADLGREQGVRPAQGQAGIWAGAAEATGIGGGNFAPEPWLRTFESRVQYTADRMGMKAADVLRKHIKGEIPLLGVGGAIGLGSVLESQQRNESR